MTLTERDIARFRAKITATPQGECWPWGSYKDTCGYGKFKIGQKQHMAHRISYLIAIGPIPKWATVLRHSCDNPGCVNPAHLQPGTQKDNAADRKARGREGKHQGELNGRSIVHASDIEEIRRSVSAGTRQTAIAKEYGITKQAVWRIVHNVTWSHL